MFLCHIKKDADYTRLAWLMSHEMLHRWIGNQVFIKDTTAFGLRHQWFKEGIDDYLSYVILLESKAFTEDQFIQSINASIRNIKENPFSDASEDSMILVVGAGKYGVAATKLAYYKGGLIGFVADSAFFVASKPGVHSRIKDLVSRLRQSVTHEQAIEEQKFFSLADSMGLPLYQLYQKHIIQGRTDFTLPQTVFNGAYILKNTTYPVYDLGFTYEQRGSQLFAQGVSPTGMAYAAGLRDGMEILSTNSVNRFSNAWCDCPVQLTVIENGKEKIIKYQPYGKKVQVPQYIKK
jgi:predicted metalloprotease with PDZ domain